MGCLGLLLVGCHIVADATAFWGMCAGIPPCATAADSGHACVYGTRGLYGLASIVNCQCGVVLHAAVIPCSAQAVQPYSTIMSRAFECQQMSTNVPEAMSFFVCRMCCPQYLPLMQHVRLYCRRHSGLFWYCVALLLQWDVDPDRFHCSWCSPLLMLQHGVQGQQRVSWLATCLMCKPTSTSCVRSGA